MKCFSHQILDALVFHKRFSPKVNKFNYKIFNLLINLDDLTSLKNVGVRLNGFGVVSFCEKKYGPRDGSSLRKWFDHLIEDYNLAPPTHLLLLTNPRILSYVFNPVSFYLAYNKDNQLYAVVAEVNNTFHDHHFYLISNEGLPLTSDQNLELIPKTFFVSPFLKIEGEYQFKFLDSKDKFSVFIDYFIKDEKKFESFISGSLQLLTKRNLRLTLLRYPLQIFKIILLIHFQGFKLWLKRIAYHKKSPPPTTQGHNLKNLPYKVQAFLKALSLIQFGHFKIISREYSGNIASDSMTESVTWEIKDWTFINDVLSRGDIGFFHAYQAQKFEIDNLPLFLLYMLKNQDTLSDYFEAKKGWQLFFRIKHLLRPNSRANAKRNIRDHYDLSNKFFELWLDKTMTYSAAYFGENPSSSLQIAQEHKYQVILDTLDLKPGSKIMEIGCGWGGFANYATQKGYVVEGITISQAQFDYIKAAQKKGKLSPFEVHLQDYRDLNGSFDGIVSIEMYEALGEEYWQTYFKVFHQLLKPGGKAVIQGITIDEKYFETYRRNPDFIQLYVFPGGMLASKERIINTATLEQLFCRETLRFGEDYAKTLKIWLSNFKSAWVDVENLGFDIKFKRLWEYYLAYCIAGFLGKRIDVNHFLIEKPQ